MHIFCDAGSNAYGTVAYICNELGSHLLMSRSRVAPVMTKSIPQLELTAVLLGCRLANYICSVLDAKFHICVWCDNLPCLQWIAGNNSNIVYVQNQVSEILSLKEQLKLRFYHVWSKENPADLLSRRSSVVDLSQPFLWLEGPTWLKDWSYDNHSHIQLPPLQVNSIITQNVLVQVSEPIFQVDKYSTLSKLFGATIAIPKFLSICSGNFATLNSSVYWIKQQQQYHYPLVYQALKTCSRENRFSESLRFIADLDLFLDDQGIICSQG